jgi:hypothetical protein
MDILTALVNVFGFWAILLLAFLAYWLGKRGRLPAFVGIGLGILVFIVGMTIGLGPSGGDGGFLVYVAYALGGLFFAGVTTVAYLYHSGMLRKIFTPK